MCAVVQAQDEEKPDEPRRLNLLKDCKERPVLASDSSSRGLANGVLVVHDVGIEIEPIFPGATRENGPWLFYLANRLHMKTRPHVLRNQMLLQPGDVYNERKADESERIIRRNSFLYDAKVTAEVDCENRVKIKAKARDLWTLLPDIGLQQSGGDTSSRIGFRDSNFLGLGKQVVLVRKSDEDREGLSFNYADPNLLGTRNTLALGYTDNDDGLARFIDLRHPFYSLDSKWSAGVFALSDERTDSLFFRNDAFQEFEHQETKLEVFGGISLLQSNWVNRWLVGFTYEQSEFFANEDTNDSTALPDDRQLSYPWVEWRALEDNFVRRRNLNLSDRTEDLNFGLDARVRIGVSSSSFDADDKGVVFAASARKSWEVGKRQVLGASAGASGFNAEDGLRNLIYDSSVRYYNNINDRQQFFAQVIYRRAKRLYGDNQLLLGADEGLRGYPSRYQTGDHLYLLSLEYRFYAHQEVWQLFNVGAAVFADTGRAWFEGQDNGEFGGPLSDVGVGLRLSPTRSGKNLVLHLDFAFPINNQDDEVDDFQINFTARSRF